MTDHEQYFSYLRQRSVLGSIYRRYFLYPRLNRQLTGKMLDIGCGIGDMLAFRPNSVGADINVRNVDYCKQIGLDAVVMAPNCLPFDHASFDSVLMDNVLEHIDEPGLLLAEIRRVLKPNGILLLGVPGIRGWSSDDDHKVFYDQGLLRECLENNLYDIKEFFYTPIMKSEALSKKLKQYCIFCVASPKK
jgi:SAM-dependent methyltransferase